MFKLFRKSTWIIAAISSLFLTGCMAEPEKALRVGTNLWPGYETLYLARDLGYFEKSPIHLVELSSTTDVLHAFRNGILEVAALTLDETLTLLQTETDLKVILIMDISNGADAIVAKPSSIAELSDLTGNRIAVENSAVGATMLIRALEHAKLSLEDVEIIPATVDKHYALYMSGEVDAVVTFDPVRIKLLNAGAKTLFDSSQINGQIVDILVTRKEFLNNRTSTLQTLVNGQFKALNYLQNHPKEAAKMLAPRLEVTPNELTKSFKSIIIPDLTENKLLMNGNGNGTAPPLHQTAKKLIAMMLERDLLFKKPQIDNLVSDRFLQ